MLTSKRNKRDKEGAKGKEKGGRQKEGVRPRGRWKETSRRTEGDIAKMCKEKLLWAAAGGARGRRQSAGGVLEGGTV
jgi:hypothetical protein